MYEYVLKYFQGLNPLESSQILCTRVGSVAGLRRDRFSCLTKNDLLLSTGYGKVACMAVAYMKKSLRLQDYVLVLKFHMHQRGRGRGSTASSSSTPILM